MLLALVFCAGPPFIALAPIPELSHLARVWGHALTAIMLVPIGWTLLFATAGALTLDATSVTHGGAGLPRAYRSRVRRAHHVHPGGEAAADAVRGAAEHPRRRAARRRRRRRLAERKLDTWRRTDARRARTAAQLRLSGYACAGAQRGECRWRVGRPARRATRRGSAGLGRRSPTHRPGLPGRRRCRRCGRHGSRGRRARWRRASSRTGGRIRARVARARTVLANAPREARAAMATGSRSGVRRPAHRPRGGASNVTGRAPARVGGTQAAGARPGGQATGPGGAGATAGTRANAPKKVVVRPAQAPAPPGGTAAAKPAQAAGARPGRKVAANARGEATPPRKPANKPPTKRAPAPGAGRRAVKPRQPAPPSQARKRKPRPRSGP